MYNTDILKMVVIMPDIEKNLKQDAEALSELEMRNGQAAGAIIEKTRSEARKWMNAMKTIGVAIKRTIEENPIDQAEHFKKILKSTESAATKIASEWGVEPDSKRDAWIVNMIEKIMVEYVHVENDCSELSKDIADAAKKSFDYPENHFKAWSNKEMVYASIFKGVLALNMARNNYTFERPASSIDGDIDNMRDIVINNSIEAMNSFVSNLTPDDERAVFLSIIIEQYFELMVSIWNKLGSKADDDCKKVTKEQLKTWKKSNPNGFSLEPVFKEFKNNASRVVRLTIAARKGEKK